MKCFFIPVIIGTTGIVTEELKKDMQTIRGQLLTDFLQKKKKGGHCTQKVLQSET